MGVTGNLFFCLLATLVCAVSSFAQTVYIPANGKGTEFTFPIPPSSPLGPDPSEVKEIQFWYLSKGKTSTAVEAKLSGPLGLKGQLEARELTGSATSDLKKSKGWFKVETKNSIETTLPQSLPSRQLFGSFHCPGFSDEVIENDLAYYGWPDDHDNYYASKVCHICTIDKVEGGKPQSLRSKSAGASSKCAGYDSQDIADELQYYKWPDTSEYRSLVCDMLWADENYPVKHERCGGVLSPIDDDKSGSSKNVGILHKNTCSSNKNMRYLVRLKVSLKDVSQKDREAGFEVKVSFTEDTWTGGMQASIKPVSDGKFAPKPIVMMVTVGGEQKIKVFNFSSSGPRMIKTLSIDASDNFFRFGKQYARTAVSSLLKGGTAVFEMTNDQKAYSVCFKLKRARQSLNGYK